MLVRCAHTACVSVGGISINAVVCVCPVRATRLRVRGFQLRARFHSELGQLNRCNEYWSAGVVCCLSASAHRGGGRSVAGAAPRTHMPTYTRTTLIITRLEISARVPVAGSLGRVGKKKKKKEGVD